jgi:Protein of unknown function (DUF2971)
MLLYHYCTNSTFLSILRGRTVRLSLLELSNDSHEGLHALAVADRLFPSRSLSKNTFRDDLEHGISQLAVLGFCLSEDGDLLSQWRGYADDAQGIAIGFDHDELQLAAKKEFSCDQSVKLRLQKVAYRNSALARMMKPDLRLIAKHDEELFSLGPIRIGGSYTETPEEKLRYNEWKRTSDQLHCRAAEQAYAFKSRFFEEEKEWRLYFAVQKCNDSIPIPNVEFSSVGGLLKPYRNFPLACFEPNLIKEVVIGPRNKTPNAIARLFLDSNEYNHVAVRRSAGTYR